MHYQNIASLAVCCNTASGLKKGNIFRTVWTWCRDFALFAVWYVDVKLFNAKTTKEKASSKKIKKIK